MSKKEILEAAIVLKHMGFSGPVFSNNVKKISFLGAVLGPSWDGLGMVLDFLGLSWAVLGPC